MATYKIELLELHVRRVTVEAASAAEAIWKLDNSMDDDVSYGDADCEGPVRHFGLDVDDHPELAEECDRLGIDISNDVIPAIRSIEEV